MAMVDRQPEFEGGYMAVLGHQMLGAVSVLSGALATLRAREPDISDADRALLQATIDQSLASVEDVARLLIHGESIDLRQAVASDH